MNPPILAITPLGVFITSGCVIALFIVIALAWSYYSNRVIVISKAVTSNIEEGMIFYHLPESELIIQSDIKVNIYYDNNDVIVHKEIVEQKYIVTTKATADTRHTFALNYNPTTIHSDEVDFKVSDIGLLESADATSEDQAADIVKQLALAPKGALDLIKGVTAATATPPAVMKEVVTKDFQKIFTVRASSLINTTGKYTLNWSIYLPNEKVVRKAGHSIDATTEMTIKNISEFITTPSGGTQTLSSFVPGTTCYRGVLSRSFRNLNLELNLKSSPNLNTNISTSILDHTTAHVVPLLRTNFVKRENHVTFKEGVIKSNKIVNPSSYRGFVSIPINIAKAVISIPAQLLSIKIDNLKRTSEFEKEKLALEKATNDLRNIQLNQELELVKLKAQIESEMIEQENKVYDQLKKRYDQEIIEKTKDLVTDTKLNKAIQDQIDAQKKVLEIEAKLNELINK